MSTSNLDDPVHDIASAHFHRARELPVPVHGSELHGLIDEVREALDELFNLPGDAAGGDLIRTSTALLGVLQFLRKLEDGFDTAAAP
jgi:hypothetical protein